VEEIVVEHSFVKVDDALLCVGGTVFGRPAVSEFGMSF
jgi:hypothetical protein